MKMLAGCIVVGAVTTALAGTASPGKVFVYPQKGQSTAQQSKDSSECQDWARTQSGIDPNQAPSASPPRPGPLAPPGIRARRQAMAARQAQQQQEGRSTYNRAFGAGMEGRGYTVK